MPVFAAAWVNVLVASVGRNAHLDGQSWVITQARGERSKKKQNSKNNK
jgi:hypothetical protein